MPNIATWWCGSAEARRAVVAAPASMVLSPALATGLPFDRSGDWRPAGELAPDMLRTAPGRRRARTLSAQEAVTLSTTPALVDGRLAPRPMTLRVFLVRTARGWRVMPGGFARIGASPDPAAVAMQEGGSAADVWVVSDRPVAPISLMREREGPFRRAGPGALPARAADNLFWLGRYIERCEGLLRLLRAWNVRLAEIRGRRPAAA